MDLGNIDTNTGVGKVIAFLVAFIIVALVAVPIVNSISDGQSGSGDSGDDSGPITYTNTGEFYYKSATADTLEHTLKIQPSPGSTDATMFFVVTVDETTILTEEYTIPGDDGIVPTSDSVLLAVCKDEGATNLYLTLSNMYAVGWFVEAGGHGEFYPGFDPEVDESGNMCWLFTIQNGKITQTSEGDSMTFDCSCYLSTTGEYVLANAPVKVASNNEILVFGTTIVDDSAHSTEWACATYYSFDALMLENGNNTIPLVSQEAFVSETTADLSCTVTDVITVNSMSVDVSMSIESRDGTYHLNATSDNLNLLVPVTVTVGSAESMEFTNVGIKYALADDSGTHTIHIVAERNNADTITVDGVASTPARFGGDDTGMVTDELLIATCVDGTYLSLMDTNTLKWYKTDGKAWEVTPTSKDGNTSVFDLTIANGIMSWTGRISLDEEITEHTTEIMFYVSDEGEYVYSPVGSSVENGSYSIKMADKGMTAYICYMRMVDVGDRWIWHPVLISGQIDSSAVSNNSSIDIECLTDYTVNSQTCVVKLTDRTGVKVITDIDVNIELQDGIVTQEYAPPIVGVFVPASFTVGGDEGGDSDSDSGAGNSGMTNTIIKLIPIFLFLGLFVAFIVPMVQSRLD